MRAVVRNAFARQTIVAERVDCAIAWAQRQASGCTECGQFRYQKHTRDVLPRPWLYRFHVDDDQGSRHSGPIAGGRLFCSRGCCESFTGQAFDETKGGR